MCCSVSASAIHIRQSSWHRKRSIVIWWTPNNFCNCTGHFWYWYQWWSLDSRTTIPSTQCPKHSFKHIKQWVLDKTTNQKKNFAQLHNCGWVFYLIFATISEFCPSSLHDILISSKSPRTINILPSTYAIGCNNFTTDSSSLIFVSVIKIY